MATTTYSQQIDDANVMASGLKQHAETMAKRGIEPEFIAALESDTAKAIQFNNEQEALKAELKQKTAQLDSTLKAVQLKVAEASKLVKVTMPKELWVAFGIKAKR
ncbi:MAG: hypothetical protein ACRC9X_02820 [Bacteroidales bacterium]